MLAVVPRVTSNIPVLVVLAEGEPPAAIMIPAAPCVPSVTVTVGTVLNENGKVNSLSEIGPDILNAPHDPTTESCIVLLCQHSAIPLCHFLNRQPFK